MRPLRIGNVGSYVRFFVRDNAGRWGRHFGPGSRRKRVAQLNGAMPASWLQYIASTRRGDILHDAGPIGRGTSGEFPATSPEEFRETQMKLLFAVLRDVYPNLQPRLDFDHPEPCITRAAWQVL